MEPEHTTASELGFFSQLYHALGRAIPVLNWRPAQMPKDYKPRRPEWDTAKMIRHVQRVAAFTERFGYLLVDTPADVKVEGTRFSVDALTKLLVGHYHNHTEKAVKKVRCGRLAQGMIANVKSPSCSRTAPSLTTVVDLFLPRGCEVCDAPLSADDGTFCVECRLQVGRDAATEYCPRCGTTATAPLVAADGCRQCRHHRTPIDSVIRVGTYAGMVGFLVKRFKFSKQQRLDFTLGAVLADALWLRPHPGR